MKRGLLSVVLCSVVLVAGCAQQGQGGAKQQTVQNATESMARNRTVQQAFSDGRVQVMQQHEPTKDAILQNTMKEQQMMMADPELRQKLIAFNVRMNQYLTNDPTGKRQLTASTLSVMSGINADSNKHRELVEIQSDSREQALRDPILQNRILQQGVNEQVMALNNPSTSRRVKELSLDTMDAIFHDRNFKTRQLTQNIQGFQAISGTPSLRTGMADAMLPLLKDPKIASELQKMIKLAVAQATQKMQTQMQQQMQQQMKQLMQQQQQMSKQPPTSSAPPSAEKLQETN